MVARLFGALGAVALTLSTVPLGLAADQQAGPRSGTSHRG